MCKVQGGIQDSLGLSLKTKAYHRRRLVQGSHQDYGGHHLAQLSRLINRDPRGGGQDPEKTAWN